ncbi:hypothetical protein, partial [Thiohalobacter sp.]|uniref:hypothetical protein n=1 Tax=Thiohalobacter sp. TaxID=2025948 RepID=UPI00262CAFCD
MTQGDSIMEDFEEWELVEDLDTEALDWMFGEEAGDWIDEAMSTSGAHGEAAARALAGFMPALIEGLHRDPAARAVIEDLSGISLEAVSPDDAEAWPAIIGALATALPSIISAIPSVVNAVQSVTGGGRRAAPPRPPARPAPPVT